MVDVKQGSCLCGAVRYQAAGPLRAIRNCHCTQCRKQTGHFAAFTAVWQRDLTLSDDRGLRWYRSSGASRRGFCGECGATLFFETLGSERISVAAGTLDGSTGLETIGHIFVADKGDYYALADDLPQDPQFSAPPPMPERS